MNDAVATLRRVRIGAPGDVGETVVGTMGGSCRFGDLRRSLHGISPKTLTDRLRHLEHVGLVTRTQYAEIPPRVEYELTETGRSLTPVMSALADFGRTLPPPSI
jgi:DNA-binding HxlR family transcriptional regulator